MSENTLLLHGAKIDAQQLLKLFDHVMQPGQKEVVSTPICIWGTHGLGKTTIVQDYAKKHGWAFAYCAPAQFEEMGDLHGLPEVVESKELGRRTIFRPPSWVPDVKGPGILLLDDLNRADDRILRGLMQLLQTHEMFSWSLPAGWHIIATANPEGGDYSVTPMDDAMLTRLLHVSLVFEAKTWATWASVNDVDSRGIAFVLTYPEVVGAGKRTTPRTLTQFFEQLKRIPDLKAQSDLVYMLAQSALDESTVASFMSFVMDGLQYLLDPEDILEAKDWSSVAKKLSELAGDGSTKRVDRLSTICTRLFLNLTHPKYEVGTSHSKNLISFLTHDSLPNDLRMALHQDLLKNGSSEVVAMMRDRKLATLMLAGM